MPMYYPDLESVKRCCIAMSKHEREKKYTGIIPETEQELILAREQLAKYLRTVWNDNVAALEVELAVNEENYEEKMSQGVGLQVLNLLKKTR